MKYLVAALILLGTMYPAEARHYRHHRHAHHNRHHSDKYDFLSGIRSIKITMKRERVSTLMPHPAGCPARAFCGCGAAVKIFGAPIRSLWLAANWYKFPRTNLAPGTVAVRRHHVFVVEQVLGNGMVLAYDANSGGHATREHVRSVSGYTIVQPRS
jgi:hypothetical protein